jgi:hypothetical protein
MSPYFVLSFMKQEGPEPLRVNGRLDFKELLTTVEGVKRVIRWLRRGIPDQFWLADKMIEEQGSGLT